MLHRVRVRYAEWLIGPTQFFGSESLNRLLVVEAVEVAIQHDPKYRNLRCGEGEQGHGRVELHRIDGAENVHGALVLDVSDQASTLDQARTEDLVIKVGSRLGKPGQRELPGGGALAQAAALRKDEPHPVAALAAAAQLGQGLRVRSGTVLRAHETRQPIRVVRGGLHPEMLLTVLP